MALDLVNAPSSFALSSVLSPTHTHWGCPNLAKAESHRSNRAKWWGLLQDHDPFCVIPNPLYPYIKVKFIYRLELLGNHANISCPPQD